MSEQEIITQYFSQHQHCANVDIGIGDDAAVVIPPNNSKLVISTDTLNEGVHFHCNCKPEHLGHKVLAVNLSDLAAMGATPLWATINLSITKIDHDWLKRFTHGLFSLADHHNIKIIGGDLVKGPLSISMQVIGYLNSDKVLTRSGAVVDDLIFVSGIIGDAGLALKLHESTKDIDISQADQEYIAMRLNKPEPRVNLGIEIVKLANAAIDISDGLLIDLQHVLSLSKVGAIIDVDKIPISNVMQEYVDNLQDWSIPLTSGEDYEIIFTANEKYISEINYISEKTQCPVNEIGRIVKGKSIKLLKGGSPIALPNKLGFDHFA